MTLNMLFFTITVHQKQMTEEEMRHQQIIEEIMEENRRKQLSAVRFL
jgi:uncharacterized protein (TIGR02413 family)